MSRCFCAYFCFCLYGLILFSSTVTSTPINNLLNDEENQDYVADATKDMTDQDVVQFTATLEPGLADNEGQTNTPPKSELGDAVKATGNTTVIIVFVCFALTMIVKGIPVVVAYSIPYFSKPSKTADPENQSPAESESDDIKKEKCNSGSDDNSNETESSEGGIKSKVNVSEETLCDTLYENEKIDNNNTDEHNKDTIINEAESESEKSQQEPTHENINPPPQVQSNNNNTKF